MTSTTNNEVNETACLNATITTRGPPDTTPPRNILKISGTWVPQIVTSTPTVGWNLLADGSAESSAAVAAAAFGSLCSTRSAAHVIGCPFTTTLESGAWAKLLRALYHGGVFSVTCSESKILTERVRLCELDPPDVLTFNLDDWQALGEAFDVPGQPRRPAAGQRGRAGYRAEVPATQGQPGPAPLRPLHLVPMDKLIKACPHQAEPALAWSLISGLLGDLGSRAEREDPGSDLRLGMKHLRIAAAALCGTAALSDEMLADLIPKAIVAAQLPLDLRGDQLHPASARLELADGVAHHFGTPAQKHAVEVRRVHNLGSDDRCATQATEYSERVARGSLGVASG